MQQWENVVMLEARGFDECRHTKWLCSLHVESLSKKHHALEPNQVIEPPNSATIRANPNTNPKSQIQKTFLLIPSPLPRHRTLNIKPRIRLPTRVHFSSRHLLVYFRDCYELLHFHNVAGYVRGYGLKDCAHPLVEAESFEDAGGSGGETDGGADEGDFEERHSESCSEIGGVIILLSRNGETAFRQKKL